VAETSRKLLPLEYSYIYGIMDGLKCGGRVALFCDNTLGAREVRAPHQFSDIPKKQELYLLWLADTFNFNPLKKYAMRRSRKRIFRSWQPYAIKVLKKCWLK